eukprot:1923022-Rhodomonas_salina.4
MRLLRCRIGLCELAHGMISAGCCGSSSTGVEEWYRRVVWGVAQQGTANVKSWTWSCPTSGALFDVGLRSEKNWQQLVEQ